MRNERCLRAGLGARLVFWRGNSADEGVPRPIQVPHIHLIGRYEAKGAGPHLRIKEEVLDLSGPDIFCGVAFVGSNRTTTSYPAFDGTAY